VVDVEQGALGTLEEHVGPRRAQPMELPGDIHHQGGDLLTLGQGLVQHGAVVQGFGLEEMGQAKL
jgi:hypothetical protein